MTSNRNKGSNTFIWDPSLLAMMAVDHFDNPICWVRPPPGEIPCLLPTRVRGRGDGGGEGSAWLMPAGVGSARW